MRQPPLRVAGLHEPIRPRGCSGAASRQRFCRRRLRYAYRGAGLLLALLTVAACRASAPTAQVPASPPLDAGPAAALSRWLPAETSWMVWVPDVERLARQWLPDGSSLRRRLQLASLQFFDDDLLSADARAGVGLDPHGCAGAAAIGARGRTTVAFACLSDPMRFTREAIRRWKQHDQQLTLELLDGGWTLLSGSESDPALLVGGTLAIGLLGDGDINVPAEARRLAAGRASESLGAKAPYAKLRRELLGEDVWGYVDLGALARSAFGLAPDLAGRTSAEAAAVLEQQWRTALERARSAGSTDEQLVALDERFRVRRRAIRDDTEARVARAWVGDTGPMGVSIDLRPNGASLRAIWLMSAAGELARAIRSSASAPGYGAPLSRRPALLLEARMDAARVGRLLDQAGVFRASGSEPAVALAQRLRYAWNGAISLGAVMPESGAEPSSPQLGVVLGLRDATAARAALDTFAESAGEGGTLRAAGSPGHYRLQLPGGPPLELAAFDDRLVAATSAEVLDAAARGRPERAPWSGVGHRLLRRLSASLGASLVVALDFGDLGAFVRAAADPWASVVVPATPAHEVGADAGEPATVNAVVEPGLVRATAQLSRRIAAIDQRLDESPQLTPQRLSARLGVVGLRLAPTPSGWGIEAAWVAGTKRVDEVLEPWAVRLLSAEGGADLEFSRLWREREQLDSERWRIEEQNATRVQDDGGPAAPGPPESSAPPADSPEPLSAP